MAWHQRIVNLFRRERLSREVTKELDFHIAERKDQLIGAGLPAAEAARQARRQFGAYALHKEDTWTADLAAWAETLFVNVRYALRGFANNPGFTAVAVITLALGIGMNSAIFSVVDAVMLRPLPYPEPQRLVALWEHNPANAADSHSSVSPANLADYRQQALLEGLAAWSFGGVNWGGDGSPERLVTNNVNYNFFDVLGVQPALGRAFLREEDQPERNHVVIISHDLWPAATGWIPPFWAARSCWMTYRTKSSA